MANQTRYSFLLRLAQTPQTNDPHLAKSLLPIHMSIHQLAQQLDQYVGRFLEYPADYSQLGVSNLNSIGLNRFYAKASAAIPAGALVYFIPDGSGSVKAALATATATTTFAQGISLAAVASGDWGEYILSDTLLETSGLTPGSIYYLSETPGELTLTAPTKIQVAGFAISATQFFVHLVSGGGSSGSSSSAGGQFDMDCGDAFGASVDFTYDGGGA